MIERFVPALRDEATRMTWSRRLLIGIAAFDAALNIIVGTSVLVVALAALSVGRTPAETAVGVVLLVLGAAVVTAGVGNGALVYGQLRFRPWTVRLGIVLAVYGLLLGLGWVATATGLAFALVHLVAYQVWRSPLIQAAYARASTDRRRDNPGP